jgi:hypothetical protein
VILILVEMCRNTEIKVDRYTILKYKGPFSGVGLNSPKKGLYNNLFFYDSCVVKETEKVVPSWLVLILIVALCRWAI